MTPRVLFICGSLNQTTQMHAIATAMAPCEAWFAPYYCDGLLEMARRAGLLEFTIIGHKLRARCLDYLRREGLRIDLDGSAADYDLVVTCSDVVVPRNVQKRRLVVVQEGILDPFDWTFSLWQKLPFLPRWIAGTAATGLSGMYDRFCVASEGYRDLFVKNGATPERVVVTGIPNFDDCTRYVDNDFPHRGYVLACTSDARETFKKDDRSAFIASVLGIAGERPVIFKLHPNEHADRAAAEIHRHAPRALVLAKGCAEHMIANCDVLVTQYSSTVFVGMAMGKEVHSYHPLSELQRLLPVQHGRAAATIADVCREVLSLTPHGAAFDAVQEPA
jgi:hypothetical protein